MMALSSLWAFQLITTIFYLMLNSERAKPDITLLQRSRPHYQARYFRSSIEPGLKLPEIKALKDGKVDLFSPTRACLGKTSRMREAQRTNFVVIKPGKAPAGSKLH